jgi:hypothetical protein
MWRDGFPSRELAAIRETSVYDLSRIPHTFISQELPSLEEVLYAKA